MPSTPHFVSLVSLPLHPPPGTLGTVTIAPRSLNAHTKKLKLGSSSYLKFTEMVNSIITLFIILISFLRSNHAVLFDSCGGGCTIRTRTFCQNWAVTFKVLHALCMLTIVLQGQANLNSCTNKLARRLELLSSIKDENDNDAVALRLFRKR